MGIGVVIHLSKVTKDEMATALANRAQGMSYDYAYRMYMRMPKGHLTRLHTRFIEGTTISGKDYYADVAEELGDPTMTLDDIDETALFEAEDYARETGKPWPPTPKASAYDMTIRRL